MNYFLLFVAGFLCGFGTPYMGLLLALYVIHNLHINRDRTSTPINPEKDKS